MDWEGREDIASISGASSLESPSIDRRHYLGRGLPAALRLSRQPVLVAVSSCVPHPSSVPAAACCLPWRLPFPESVRFEGRAHDAVPTTALTQDHNCVARVAEGTALNQVASVLPQRPAVTNLASHSSMTAPISAGFAPSSRMNQWGLVRACRAGHRGFRCLSSERIGSRLPLSRVRPQNMAMPYSSHLTISSSWALRCSQGRLRSRVRAPIRLPWITTSRSG